LTLSIFSQDSSSSSLSLLFLDRYPKYSIPLFYMLASFTCAVSFYGGRWIDGFIAFLFGFFVYFLETLCGRIRGLTQIEGFLATTVISFVGFTLSKYVLTPLEIPHCPYAQIFGAIVWLLPGITLSISLLELYSSMIAYGSSRLLYGIAMSAQLGFGLGVGFSAANPKGGGVPDDLLSGCLAVNGSPLTQLLLLLIASATFGMICNIEFKRIPGILLTSLVGFLLASYTIVGSTSLILAAFGVTITARLYSYWIRRRYLLYIYGGLLVLVPGSVSVKGFIGIWSGDHASAIEFTLLMLINCICLAVGVFLGLLPRKKWMLWRQQKLREFLCWVCNTLCGLGVRLYDCGIGLQRLVLSVNQTAHHFLVDGNDHHSDSCLSAVTGSRQHRSSSIDQIEVTVISPEPSSHTPPPLVSLTELNDQTLSEEENLTPRPPDVESGRSRFSSTDSETLLQKSSD
jgi:uncharacterized membrane protein YjjB (DUF3815 family)